MAKVTNNHSSALNIGGVVIAAKSDEEVPNWDKISLRGVISRWLDSGILSVGKSSKKDEPEVIKDVQITEEQHEEPSDKDALIAQLAELGIEADKRSSVKKLQEKLDEALAK